MEQPKGNLRKVQKAETRSLILKSARSLFDSLDYDSVTIRGVASHAEIGLGTIYKHFPNKLSMLAAAFFDDLKALYEDAVATIPEDALFKFQFIHISKHFFNFYTSHYSLSHAYLSHLFFFDSYWRDQINAFDDSYAGKIAEMIRTAQKQGEISLDKESDTLAQALMSHYFFVLINGFFRDGTANPDQMAAMLEALMEQTLY